ncbi:hypothetical protein EAL2_808p00200 (plasmid) [Peptoclostridium acidaminophilum DSM 3953]|uniref:Uncharacterized protein n=1 Tax=Peptoclostridium acidaminophilum DSM 3953 TaxID=1286171 RepID=W8TMV4_PEPAC|nr:hypothetical protein EAL2_808p00200 [Peptoclostridium acidaminophilum DSM 3953]
MFQFTHPHGVRRQIQQEINCVLVSIHAPARGATSFTSPSLVSEWCFNSRTRTGCDKLSVIVVARIWFQFTHPHGVRHTISGQYSKHYSFNSRTRTGCDGLSSPPKPHELTFQFTHPHGVRLAGNHVYIFYVLFQFTHPHGVRQRYYTNDNIGNSFQFTHPHGVRLIPKNGRDRHVSFNSRTRTGCDQATEIASVVAILFQFTHPHGVRHYEVIDRNALHGFQFTHLHGVRRFCSV